MTMKKMVRKAMKKKKKNRRNEHIYLNIFSGKTIFGIKIYINQITKINNIKKLILNYIGIIQSF